MHLLIVLFSLAAAGSASAQTPAPRFEPYRLTTAAGPVEAELGRLAVPERRGTPGRSIEIAFVRVKSLKPATRPPVIYLDGGPGGGGFGVARLPHFWEIFQALGGDADIILLSQRGTGLSTPRLTCPAGERFPADYYESRDTMARALLPRGLACVKHWSEQGVDIGAFNTEESADDIDDLRKALGAERVSLVGFSYGTHLALAAIRRHESSIDRAVLLGTEGANDTWKPPLAYDLQVNRIAAVFGAPDFPSQLRALLARLDAAPAAITIQLGHAPVTLSVGGDGVRALLAQDLGDTNDIAAIVRGVREAGAGNYTLLGQLAQRRFTAMNAGGGNLMSMAMDCASGASAPRLAEIREQEPHSMWRAMVNFPFPDACSGLKLPMLAATFRQPVAAATPALFVSGDLDVNTPPYQAEQARWGLPNSEHLIVRNAGHESTLEPAAVRAAIVSFLSGGRVASATIEGYVPQKVR